MTAEIKPFPNLIPVVISATKSLRRTFVANLAAPGLVCVEFGGWVSTDLKLKTWFET